MLHAPVEESKGHCLVAHSVNRNTSFLSWLLEVAASIRVWLAMRDTFEAGITMKPYVVANMGC